MAVGVSGSPRHGPFCPARTRRSSANLFQLGLICLTTGLQLLNLPLQDGHTRLQLSRQPGHVTVQDFGGHPEAVQRVRQVLAQVEAVDLIERREELTPEWLM